MTQPTAPVLGVIDGTRDAELKRLAIYGTNAELAEAVATLKRRAVLKEVPQGAEAPAERSSD